MKEMVGGCCVCSDDRGWSENPLVYCDGQSCTVAVHQACYGIVTVPTGPWYCRKCESQERSVKVKCELCPSKYGALKRTDNSGWAHVVCALYIPEVRFGNVTTMEPIQLQLIPAERFNKICYICEEKGKPSNATVGACMQCNKAGCKQQFHVTCAQGLGLLCEEAGNYLDNVKYCGYCQHHYSKLKKGGNVKTIPPYKPIANEAHNSDSEKEPETGSSKNHVSPPVNKKRSGVSGKTTPSKASHKSNSSQPKTVHNIKNSDKTKVSNSSVGGGGSSGSKSDKSAEVPSVEQKLDKSDQKSVGGGDSAPLEVPDKDKEVNKDTKSGKKRKVNSRTPTPVSVSVSAGEVSVVVTPVANTSPTSTVAGGDNKKSTTVGDISAEKVKKAKVDTTQSLALSQPVVALTSIATIKASSPTIVEPVSAEISTQSQVLGAAQTQSQSLVVSVPLVSTSLTDHQNLVGSGQVATLPNALMPERSNSVGSVTERMSVISSGGNSNQGLLSSDMNVGGLKIGYEKQVDSINTEEDMELELEPSPSAIVEEPMTRSRTQSNDKTERPSRGKKRNSNGNNTSSVSQPATSSVNNAQTQKRSSRSQNISPSREVPGAFAAISQTQIKTSPPRTPSPEGGGNSNSRSSRTKGRKSAPASLNTASTMKDTKDIKVFQNGLNAPHMLGNQLNPTSTMHSKMNEHLNSEMEAHSIFNANENSSNLVGPPLQHKIVQSTRASSTGSSTASGSSGLSSMLGGGGGGSIPQTLDQLLERQWEQGSQFLMEQAQHFDIASLLSCLHQLRAENMRLEEHVASLLQRRDHLLAVNARLAIPLTGQPAVSQPQTVNNIHPQVNVNEDLPRSHGSHVRSSSTNRYPNQGPDPSIPSHEDVRSSHRSSSTGRYSGSSQHPPVDNGLPDGYSHGSQHSPTVRHSPVAAYPNSGLHRQNIDGRTAPRPQSYHLYDRPGPSQSQQMVMRDRDRDIDMYHHKSSKPS